MLGGGQRRRAVVGKLVQGEGLLGSCHVRLLRERGQCPEYSQPSATAMGGGRYNRGLTAASHLPRGGNQQLPLAPMPKRSNQGGAAGAARAEPRRQAGEGQGERWDDSRACARS